VRDEGASERSWRGPLDSLPVIVGMPAKFVRVLEELEAVGSTNGPEAWSRLECVAHVAEVFHATAKRLRLIFGRARTELTPTHSEFVGPGLHSGSLPIIRGAFLAAAADLAEAVHEGEPSAWALTALEGDRVVNAETLLREALDDAHDHLSDLQQMLYAAMPPNQSE
jgi:hypothetical protein